MADWFETVMYDRLVTRRENCKVFLSMADWLVIAEKLSLVRQIGMTGVPLHSE